MKSKKILVNLPCDIGRLEYDIKNRFLHFKKIDYCVFTTFYILDSERSDICIDFSMMWFIILES